MTYGVTILKYFIKKPRKARNSMIDIRRAQPA